MTRLATILLLATAINAQFAGDAAAGSKPRDIATRPTKCRVNDAGGTRYSRGRGRARGAVSARGRRGFRICGARDAAGRTLRAADERGRTRRGLTSFVPCTEILPPRMIWMITTCVLDPHASGL